MKKLIICLFLVGCGHSPGIPNSKPLNIPEKVFYSCPDLPIAKSTLDDDLLEQSSETFKMYQECRKWNDEKNKILKQLTN